MAKLRKSKVIREYGKWLVARYRALARRYPSAAAVLNEVCWYLDRRLVRQEAAPRPAKSLRARAVPMLHRPAYGLIVELARLGHDMGRFEQQMWYWSPADREWLLRTGTATFAYVYFWIERHQPKEPPAFQEADLERTWIARNSKRLAREEGFPGVRWDVE